MPFMRPTFHSLVAASLALLLVVLSLTALHLAPRPEARADIVSPDNTVSYTAVSAGGAAQTNTATLAATSGRVNYLIGFDVTGGGATAASIIEISITGLAAGTLKYEVPILAGVTGPAFGGTSAPYIYSVRFPVPLPASAVNTAISVAVPSFGSGNTNANVVAYGYLK
jgi:hypothetical protein